MAKSGKPQLKSAIVTRMLGRERGASIGELAKATGWQDPSVRAFLTGVRKQAELIKEERADGLTAYRLAPAAVAADAPQASVTDNGE
jgi:hypothetical protein